VADDLEPDKTFLYGVGGVMIGLGVVLGLEYLIEDHGWSGLWAGLLIVGGTVLLGVANPRLFRRRRKRKGGKKGSE